MRYVLISILTFVAAGCLSNIPPSYDGPSGMAQIQFDSASVSAVQNYIEGSGLEAMFNYSDREHFELLTVMLHAGDSVGVFEVDTAQNRRITITSNVPPFFYESDSGTITVTARTADTVAGSFSVRMIGDDSSIHHLGGTFVAVPRPQNPG